MPITRKRSQTLICGMYSRHPLDSGRNRHYPLFFPFDLIVNRSFFFLVTMLIKVEVLPSVFRFTEHIDPCNKSMAKKKRSAHRKSHGRIYKQNDVTRTSWLIAMEPPGLL